MRNRFILLADIPLLVAAALGAFILRFDWRFYGYRPEFLPFVLAVVVVKPVAFLVFGMYGRYWRYASVNEILLVVLANSGASAVLAVLVSAALAFSPRAEFSRAVLVIDWLLSLFATGGLRLSTRILADARLKAARSRGAGVAKRVVVVGAGEAGRMVVREIQSNPQLGLAVAGFLDDDREKFGKRIQGVRVLGGTKDLARAVQARSVDEVLIAMPTAPGRVIRAVAEECRRLGVDSRTVPGVFELLDGRVSVSRLRPVEISDLLRRAPVRSDGPTAQYLEGRRVLVTGAGGSIGSELCRQIARVGPASLVLLGHGENSLFDAWIELREAFPATDVRLAVVDVRDRERLTRVFVDARPEVVFHAAAHKHVPLMEDNPEEAVTTNVFGTLHVVEAAQVAGTQRLVLVSTDKAVRPASVMGASKRVAELVVREAARLNGAAFIVVRFGNVLGSRGSVVPLFKRQIERGGPVTVTHPAMKRFFMTIPEAVHLLLVAGGIGAGGELFALDMGEPVAVVDLAQDLIRLSGFSTDEVPIVFSGLRPGEKLEEALWEPGAKVEPTEQPQVLRIVEPETDEQSRLHSVLLELQTAVASGDRLAIRAALAECVPSYAPCADTLWDHSSLRHRA